jgi:hypothetical protein
MFEGRRDKNAPRRDICLHSHEYSPSDNIPIVTFDFDSICGLPSHLGAFKSAIKWFPCTTAASTISGKIHGVHFGRSDDEYEPIEQMTHPYFGELSHWKDIKIYILFPNIYFQRRRKNGENSKDDIVPFLTNEQQESWYNNVVYPSLKDILPSSLTQDIPSSYMAAVSRSKASYDERVRAQPGSSRIQLLSIDIQAKYIYAIWESILQKANLIEEFDNIQIFFNGKGLKGAISASNFIDLSQQWSQLWSSNINDDYIDSDSYWLDLGRQITPSGNAEPMCLLWKECCLKHYHNVRTRPYGNVSSSPISYYRLAFLRDSSSVIIAPKRGGLSMLQTFDIPSSTQRRRITLWRMQSRFLKALISRTLLTVKMRSESPSIQRVLQHILLGRQRGSILPGKRGHITILRNHRMSAYVKNTEAQVGISLASWPISVRRSSPGRDL